MVGFGGGWRHSEEVDQSYDNQAFSRGIVHHKHLWYSHDHLFYLFHLLIGTSVSSRKAIVDSNEINLDEEANVDEESFRSDLERDSAHSSMT